MHVIAFVARSGSAVTACAVAFWPLLAWVVPVAELAGCQSCSRLGLWPAKQVRVVPTSLLPASSCHSPLCRLCLTAGLGVHVSERCWGSRRGVGMASILPCNLLYRAKFVNMNCCHVRVVDPIIVAVGHPPSPCPALLQVGTGVPARLGHFVPCVPRQALLILLAAPRAHMDTNWCCPL
jgi:hypothetical protein